MLAQDAADNTKAKLVTPESREEYINIHPDQKTIDFELITEKYKKLIKERLSKSHK